MRKHFLKQTAQRNENHNLATRRASGWVGVTLRKSRLTVHWCDFMSVSGPDLSLNSIMPILLILKPVERQFDHPRFRNFAASVKRCLLCVADPETAARFYWTEGR